MPNFRIAFRFATFAPQRAWSNAENVRSKIFAVAVKNGFCVVEMSLITSFLVEAKTCCYCLAGKRATVRPVFLRTKGVNRAFFRDKKTTKRQNILVPVTTYDRQSVMSIIPYIVGKIKKYHNILCFKY